LPLGNPNKIPKNATHTMKFCGEKNAPKSQEGFNNFEITIFSHQGSHIITHNTKMASPHYFKK